MRNVLRHHKTSEELSLEQSWRPTQQEVDGAKLAPDTAQANTMRGKAAKCQGPRTTDCEPNVCISLYICIYIYIYIHIYIELRKASGNAYIQRPTQNQDS